MARRNIQKWELKMSVGSEQVTQPNGRKLGDRDGREAPFPVVSQRPVRNAGWGAPSLNIPSWLLLFQLFHSRNKSVKTWLAEPHSAAQKGAGRGGL